MKKYLLPMMVCTGLLINSMASAISPKRFYECATQPDKNNCSDSEKKAARGWIIGISLGALTTFLIAWGVIRGPHVVKEAKKQAIDAKIRAINIEKSSLVGEENAQRMSILNAEAEQLREERRLLGD